MDKFDKVLDIDSSPHIISGNSTEHIMRHVIYALMPTVAFAIYAFGIAALLILFVAVMSCVMSEHVLAKINRQQTSITDGSAIITGILYGLTLPPNLPLWMVMVGGIIAITFGKAIFGGLGCNVFNPALVGRAFLQAAFPNAMTTWYPAFEQQRFSVLPESILTFPFASPNYDTVSAATPLAAMKFEGKDTSIYDLSLGFIPGSLGETCAIVILMGGVYLVMRNMMRWQIPAGIFAAILLMSGLLHTIDAIEYPAPDFMLFSGGLMLAAIFMATDMVASPLTALGCFVYGVIIGMLVVAIRVWGGMPEGVMYAVLMANAISPHIDLWFPPRVFGARSTS